jgi:hypothetical protein
MDDHEPSMGTALVRAAAQSEPGAVEALLSNDPLHGEAVCLALVRLCDSTGMDLDAVLQKAYRDLQGELEPEIKIIHKLIDLRSQDESDQAEVIQWSQTVQDILDSDIELDPELKASLKQKANEKAEAAGIDAPFST